MCLHPGAMHAAGQQGYWNSGPVHDSEKSSPSGRSAGSRRVRKRSCAGKTLGKALIQSRLNQILRWTMIRRFGLFLLTLPVAAAFSAAPAFAQYYSSPPPGYYRDAPPPGTYYDDRRAPPAFWNDNDDEDDQPARRQYRSPQMSQLPPPPAFAPPADRPPQSGHQLDQRAPPAAGNDPNAMRPPAAIGGGPGVIP